MIEFDVYKDYLALKNHFNSNYDYFKYNGKINVKMENFVNRKDFKFFVKLSKNPEYHDFLVFVFHKYKDIWIGDILNNDVYRKDYLAWKGYMAGFYYNFKKEMKSIKGGFIDSLKSNNKKHPQLLKKFLQQDVSFETVIMIDSLTNCIDKWDVLLSDDFMWDNIKTPLLAYRPFVDIDSKKEEIKKILIDVFK